MHPPTGGGRYPADERGREAILIDLAEGLLTPECAKAQYGFTGQRPNDRSVEGEDDHGATGWQDDHRDRCRIGDR
jgi:N-methylhydantoinase B/oxoprolinase/acetone carboxylase alpha subunit